MTEDAKYNKEFIAQTFKKIEEGNFDREILSLWSAQRQNDYFMSEKWLDVYRQFKEFKNDSKSEPKKIEEVIYAEVVYRLGNMMLSHKGLSNDCVEKNVDILQEIALEYDAIYFENKSEVDSKTFTALRTYKDISTILNSEELDIYLLSVCLDLDNVATEKQISGNPQLKEKVLSVLGDPMTIKELSNFNQKEYLKDIVDIEKIVKTTTEALKKLPGDQVYYALEEEPHSQRIQDAQNLKKLLSFYYQHIKENAFHSRYYHEDLFYTGFKTGAAWREVANSVDLLGKYKESRALDMLVKERIKDVFSLRILESYQKPKDRFFGYVNATPAAAFAKKMTDELKNNPDSSLSKYFLDSAQGVFKHRDGSCLGEDKIQEAFMAMALDLIKNYKDEESDIADRIVKTMLSFDYPIDILGDVYKIYQSKAIYNKLTKIVNKNQRYNPLELYGLAKDINHKNLLDKSYTIIQNDPQYLDIHTGNLLEHIDYSDFKKTVAALPIKGMDVYIGENNEKKLEIVKDLISGNKKMTLVQINVSEDIRELDIVDALSCNPELTKICSKTVMKDTYKLIEKLPLKALFTETDKESVDKIYEQVVETKPKNLEIIDISGVNRFTPEQATTLMTKYPNLVIKNYQGRENCDSNSKIVDSLIRRNEAVLKALKSDKPIEEAIREKVIVPYLQAIEPKDMPRLTDFQQSYSSSMTYLDYIKEEYSEEKYPEVLMEIAKIAKFDGKLIQEIEISEAIKNGTLVDFIKGKETESRPTVQDLNLPNILINPGVSAFELLKETSKDDEDYNSTVKEILFLIGVDNKTLAKLEGDKNIGEAAAQVVEAKKIEARSTSSKASFEAWRAKKSNMDK